MPGYARREIVREGEIGIYHTWSRCVQKALLCGNDPETGINFDYRRERIRSLLKYQASVFAVDVANYSVLSNHQHLVARTRPDIAALWSDEEVAWRWKLAWPSWIDGQWVREPTDEEVGELLAHPENIQKLRANLASLSWFMARWKEPIARMANAEMDRKGHFYEQRYGSREIVDDAGNLCCSIYLDMNQLKAGMAPSLEESRCSAIHDRLRVWCREEALASVEAFHQDGAKGFSLEAEDIQRLLTECFLVPIGNQESPIPKHTLNRLNLHVSPAATAASESLTPSQAESSTRGIADSVPAEPLVELREDTKDPVEDRVASVSATSKCAPAGEPISKGKKRGRQPIPRPTPTRKIHERLQSRRRSRASSDPYLGVPSEQYLEILCCTVARWLATRNEKSPSRALPENIAKQLRQWGIAPEYWCEALDKFASWFHRAVGNAKSLKATMERANKRWLQGIRHCREVFT